MIVDTDETKLWGREWPVEDLRKELEGLWPPHELTKSEKERLFKDVSSILDLTRTLRSDFHTLIDCVKSVARYRALLLEYSGVATSWDSRKRAKPRRAKQCVECVCSCGQ
jgi:hypothetical protein